MTVPEPDGRFQTGVPLFCHAGVYGMSRMPPVPFWRDTGVVAVVDPGVRTEVRTSGRGRRSVDLDAPERLVAGVAGSLGVRLGASPLVVRTAFAVAALAAGLGVVVYGVLWFVGVAEVDEPPRRTLRHDLGIVALTASALVVVFGLVPSVPPQLLGPLAFVSFALAMSAGSSVDSDLRSGRAFGRIAVGVALMLGGLAAGAAAIGDVGQVWVIGAATAAVIVGVGVVLAPWLRHLVDGASADRVERIRAEERADIAAHLHDSVLQTLTLIQNRAHEPEITSALAYQQERELRRWLYRSAPADNADGDRSTSMRSHLADIVATVEDDYHVVVDVVCVGDAEVDPAVTALSGAVREALVNAAKFADTRQISLYVELDDHRVTAYVRDRGVGFDPDLVASDRRGIADSIHARVERVGGEAVVRSTAGAGTEVRVQVPRR